MPNLTARDLIVSLIQADTRWHDAPGNQALYGGLMAQLPRSDLIVLPETFMSGFSNDALPSAETMDGAQVAWMRQQARTFNAVVTGSLLVRVHDQVYNRLIWAQPNGDVAYYDKRHLFRMAREHERYGSGSQRLVVELAGWKICPMVCYDLRFPVFARNRFASTSPDSADYDLLLFVANWPAARAYAWRTLLRARAIENLSFCLGVNRVGTDGNGLSYAGDSVALDYLGQPLLEAGAQAQSLTVQLSARDLLAHRERFPAYLDADRFQLES
jgi:omega-amidase